jgi:hypothetical protein
MMLSARRSQTKEIAMKELLKKVTPIIVGLLLFIAETNRVAAPALYLVASLVVAVAGAVLLHHLLHFKHGLLDRRRKTRTDVIGGVIPEPEEGVIDRLLSLTAMKRFGVLFGQFVFKQLSIDSNRVAAEERAAAARDDGPGTSALRPTETSEVNIKSLPEFAAEMMKRFATPFEKHEDMLLRGDLEGHAKKLWPYWVDSDGNLQGQFELHFPLPADMEPSIYLHDKLISGDDVSFLCYRELNQENMTQAYATSLQRIQETVSYVPAAAMTLGLGIAGTVFPMLVTAAQSKSVGLGLALFGGITFAAGVATWILGTLAKMALHVRSVAAFANAKVNSDESLRTTTPAVMRNNEEIKSPTDGLPQLRSALRMAMADPSAVFALGTATGSALLHGKNPAYAFRENQIVAMSQSDATRNKVVLGGTGLGKTTLIVPDVYNVMNAPFDAKELKDARAGGYRMTCSFVSFDMKNELHTILNPIAKLCGWTSRNIGTGPGDFGLDLFAGLSPVLASAVMSEAVSQKSGGAVGNDPFWGSMGAKIRFAALVVARAYQATDAGLAEVERTGELIYSPAGAYKLAMACRENEGTLFKVVENIIRNLRDKELRRYVMRFAGPELIAAIDFLRRDLKTLFSETTVGGFLANVADSMADFVSENDIRERFGAASGENILDFDSLWDHRTLSNFCLSATEYGEVARVISLMAKIRFYHWGAVRFEKDRTVGRRCKQNVIIDEAHQFVSKGGNFSEAVFFNVSRGMGFAVTLSTQTISALIEALGSEDAVYNMLAQLTTKYFLGSKDSKTVEYMRFIVGTAWQTRITSDGRFESRLTWQKKVYGKIREVVASDPMTNEEVLALSHPLVHGRVEPLLRPEVDVLGESYAANDTEAYEAMFVHGEDWVTQYSPQGFIKSAVKRGIKSLMPRTAQFTKENRFDNSWAEEHVFPNLDLAIGECVVAVSRGTLPRADKILTKPFTLPAAAPASNDDGDATATKLKSAAERVAQQRAENASLQKAA